MGKKTKKTICLITPGHLSSNPRLVKEAQALQANGFFVHILFIQSVVFLIPHDQLIIEQNPGWKLHALDITKSYFKSKVLGLAQKLLTKFFFKNLNIKTAVFLKNKNYFTQLKIAKSIGADIYIAHNVGALPVAVEAAKHNNSFVGFDAEDYHRHEITNDVNSDYYILNKTIEDFYIPSLHYLTCASPLIVKKYKQHYPLSVAKVINNVFSIQNLQQPTDNKSESLKLFWFSQTIGKDRGLEDIINALNLLETEPIKLILLGNISDADKIYFNSLLSAQNLSKGKVEFIKTVPENQLYHIAAQYDIGLVLERKVPENKNVCLTNKSFTYLLAGLTTISTDTAAQKLMLEENPYIGKFYQTGDIQTLTSYLKYYLVNRDKLYRSKLEAQKIAKEKYNWENESQKFLEIINEL